MLFPRAGRVVALALFFVLASFVGCGRASLLGYESEDAGADAEFEGGFDAGDAGDAADARDGNADGGDAGTCNAKNCPNGCCDAKGQCRNGTELTGCGGPGGAACVDCSAKGFDFCDGSKRVCAREVTVCNSTTCADGCCGKGPGDAGLACFAGTGDSACGTGGVTCAVCNTGKDGGAPSTCDPSLHSCVAPTCNAKNCGGCCDMSGKCQPGDVNTVCGANGASCTDCTKKGASCIASGLTGGACEGPPPPCGPANCPNGCCVGDTCVGGTADTACGAGGKDCANCAGQNEVCKAQACEPPPPTCTAQNCSGCCDSSGTCFAGFLNTRCGSGGASCADCTTSGATCDGAITPRVCDSAQSTCPASYTSCAASVTEAAPTTNKSACSTADLQDAQQACSAGPYSQACLSYFGFLGSNKPACGTCLAPFHFMFQEARGIYSCVEPFVSTTCNHRTGCAIDCVDTSCGQCSAASEPQCENNVEAFGGQCRTYFNNTGCVASALFGSGSFCNPSNYKNNYGSWLQGVGGHYCAP